LDPGAAQQAPFGEDDGPGDEAESQQGDQDKFGDRTGVRNKVENFAADEKGRVWEQLHLILEDTFTGL
jgi:hypothetical protein